jgi:hypothetical protein
VHDSGRAFVRLSGGGNKIGAAHQAGFAAGGGVLMDDATLGGFIQNADRLAQDRRDHRAVAGGDGCVRLLNERLHGRLRRTVAQVALARAEYIFLNRFDIRHFCISLTKLSIDATRVTALTFSGCRITLPGLQWYRPA